MSTLVRRRWPLLALASFLLIAVVAGAGSALAQESQTGDLPVRPEWLANTLGRATKPGTVKNNVTPGAIARRDRATHDWKAAEAAWRKGRGREPNPLAKPEYSVVWSSKQNAADTNANVVSKFIQNATINPQGLTDLLNPQFAPGLDGFQVIDERKQNIDGSENSDYGKVVNFVQLPLPWGFENEAHHMQYSWDDGDPIVAGGLYTGTTFVLDPKGIPNLRLQNTIEPTQNPNGSIADAFEKNAKGRFVLTLMGGPLSNFGGSPGQLITFKPDKKKGLVKESEVSAGKLGGVVTGNGNGIKEPCTVREAGPVETGTCANPHGIEFRPDIKVGITADYAEPRQIVLDPVKTVDKYVFRPTIRSWDLSNPSKPKLKGVAHVPDGPQKPAQRAHDQRGIMEDAKTWPDAKKRYNGINSKGFFASSMCGGGVFFVPDGTKTKGDFSNKVVQVWNDGLSAIKASGKYEDEPTGCPGGAWHQVAPSNKLFFRAVQGRNPGSDNVFDAGAEKMIYTLNIAPLIKSAQDGKVLCDLSRGIHKGGYDLTGIQLFNKLARGKTIADCPKLVSTLKVNDPTTGGPHWGALDNQSFDENGVPWRLNFSNYFVSRTGVDGDHRFYTVDVSPKGKLSYDEDFRDEDTGSLGVNFNRRDWPGSPDAGFYKPHSMVWVCPPGICPKNATPAYRGSCLRRPVSLVSATRKRRKVRLRGLVNTGLAGRKVSIYGKYGKRTRRLARVRADSRGRFGARVRGPARRYLRRARYTAKVGRARSRALKLYQQVASRSIKAKKGRITITGRVKRNLLGKRKRVVIRSLYCGRYKKVASVRPKKNGSYRVRFKIPAGGRSALYRAETRLLERPHGKRYVKRYARAVFLSLSAQSG